MINIKIKGSSFFTLPATMVAVLMAAPLVAQEDPKWGFSLGAFLTEFDSDTRIDASNDNIGFETSLEDDLGVNSKDNVFRVDGYYKFNNKHRMDFDIFSISRSGGTTLTTTLQWGDQEFAIDTPLATDFNFDIYKAAYTYVFKESEKGYLGLTGGLYIADVGLSVVNLNNINQSSKNDITAPLPVFGLRGNYALNDRWTLRGSTEYFFIEVDKIKGELLDFYAGLDYELTQSASIGLGYNYVDLGVDSNDSDLIGSLNWQYDGALLYLRFDY